MDVLVIEDTPGAAEATVAELEAAGHHVHRCFDEGGSPYPCKAAGEHGRCPLDLPVDVAVLARTHIGLSLTLHERGASCVLRAGIPMVATESEPLDPLADWLSDVDRGDIVATCRAVAGTRARLEATVLQSISDVVSDEGVDPADVACHIEVHEDSMVIRLTCPTDLPTWAKAVIVARVLDTVSGSLRRVDHVRVDVVGPGGGSDGAG